MAWVAARHGDVLTAILYAYSFMVSALFVPTLGAYFWSRSGTAGALGGMLAGGGCTLALLAADLELPLGLHPTAFGILLSALVFIVGSVLRPDRARPLGDIEMRDRIERFGASLLQHGPHNDRVYLMHLDAENLPAVIDRMEELAGTAGLPGGS